MSGRSGRRPTRKEHLERGCMQLASYQEGWGWGGGQLMWMMPLHLSVNQISDNLKSYMYDRIIKTVRENINYGCLFMYVKYLNVWLNTHLKMPGYQR